MKGILTIILVLLFSKSYTQIPYNLNSYPEAINTIYLDFDGQTITDPLWTTYAGGVFYCDKPAITNEQIIRIFNLVSEDFRPFDINVTTDSTVFFSSPLGRRMRVVITSTGQWYNGSGGTAFIESWRWSPNIGDVPCFAFSNILSNNDKLIAEVVSHEVGHTLGLYHQSRYAFIGTDTCRFVFEYEPGRGTVRAETSWAPIMGNSYNRNLTLWHNGRTLNCNSIQDDIRVITSSINRVRLRPDEVGNNIQTASIVNFTNAEFNINGIINTSTDTDYYRFDFTTPCRFTAIAKPYSPGPRIHVSSFYPYDGTENQGANIDLKLTLFKDNDFIAEYNPTLKVDASIDTLLNPGRYHIAVSNTVNQNIDNYGMLGSYSIVGKYDNRVSLGIESDSIRTIRDELIKGIVVYSDSRGGVYIINLPNYYNLQYIRIFAVNGNLLKSINSLQRTNKIDISSYPPGIYIFNISGIKSFKIVKH